MGDEQDFQNLQKADFHDAGPLGLAVRLQTEPSPATGRTYVLGFLSTPERGRKLYTELAIALERKFPGCLG